MTGIGNAIRAALLTGDPRVKVMATRRAARDWRRGQLEFVFDCVMPDRPARPDRPELLPPNRMPKRGRGESARSRIALWHSLAHIEFVAIDLALDMAGRFGSEMGPEFVSDFLAVAADEAMHFVLIDRHLRTMGSFYGDLPAHDGLWQSAFLTRGDVAARLAVVPMVLEARGLDVTPAMLERVSAQGDFRGAAILRRILSDEIRHVAVGTRHFTALCNKTCECPSERFKALVAQHFRGSIRGPFNDSARQSAGLSLSFYGGIAC